MHVEGHTVQAGRTKLRVEAGHLRQHIRCTGMASRHYRNPHDDGLLGVGHEYGAVAIRHAVGADRERNREQAQTGEQVTPQPQLRFPALGYDPHATVAEFGQDSAAGTRTVVCDRIVERERLRDIEIAALVEGQRVGHGNGIRSRYQLARPILVDSPDSLERETTGEIDVAGGIYGQTKRADISEIG